MKFYNFDVAVPPIRVLVKYINSRGDVLLDLRKIISNLRRLNWTGIDDD